MEAKIGIWFKVATYWIVEPRSALGKVTRVCITPLKLPPSTYSMPTFDKWD